MRSNKKPDCRVVGTSTGAYFRLRNGKGKDKVIGVGDSIYFFLAVGQIAFSAVLSLLMFLLLI